MNTINDKRVQRAGFAAAFSAAAVLSLGLLAGVGFAGDGVSADQYQYGPKAKTAICHKGKTITVSNSALPAHKKHGDTVGACAADKRKGKKKAEKAKSKPEQKAAKPSEESKKTDDGAKAAPGKSEERGKSGDAPGKSEGKGKGK